MMEVSQLCRKDRSKVNSHHDALMLTLALQLFMPHLCRLSQVLFAYTWFEITELFLSVLAHFLRP